jgi:SEC-C motif-containing protein
MKPCHCGSGKPFAECCQPLLDGKQPALTAEALMRSRYTAYVLENFPYLRDTYHSSTRPATTTLGHDQSIKWLQLQVLETRAGQPGDDEGKVRFVATFQQGDHIDQMAELSRFAKEEGEWRYIDGKSFDINTWNATHNKPAKIKRNDPCPCGSGKKYKKCCGSGA